MFLQLPLPNVTASLHLFQNDCTIPFIARYRKELTGNLDEVQLSAIQDLYSEIQALEKRREFILESLRQGNNLSAEIEKLIREANNIATLEDIYLPFKPKRRTRAQIAIEQGLSALAEALIAGQSDDPFIIVQGFINENSEINTVEKALQGAMDIISERFCENLEVRSAMRELFQHSGIINCTVNKKNNLGEKSTFRDYFDFSESVRTIKSHRLLAIFRGEALKELNVRISVDRDTATQTMERIVISPIPTLHTACKALLRTTVVDCFDRLLGPSMENDIRNQLKTRSDLEAIRIFAQNLREILLASPLGPMPIIALDPGFRSGCKLVVLNELGDLLNHQTIYPLEPQRQVSESSQTIRSLIQKYSIGAIAIGNGTAGRETMAFCKSLDLAPQIKLCQVNESGASIYSASEIARQEFPELDLTVRGAISIGRRLMDPLAELVKINPQSIGVGQYQHDVDQKLLQKSLETTVISCVNSVGVNLNTASSALLQYISGLSSRSAQSIVAYRSTKGKFQDRQQLLDVPGIGPKTFEQAAGFLRISDGDNLLDACAVHPESYRVVMQMAEDLQVPVQDLFENEALLKELAKHEARYKQAVMGVSVRDILDELAKPGRDPRPQLLTFQFDEAIKGIEDLTVGLKLPGIVSNVAAFGAFVDIGIHEQGLVHISQLSNTFVKDPYSMVKPGQTVMVRVIAVDAERKRVSLSLRDAT